MTAPLPGFAGRCGQLRRRRFRRLRHRGPDQSRFTSTSSPRRFIRHCGESFRTSQPRARSSFRADFRSAKRDAEDRRNPRRLARAVRATAFVRPVVEATDEMTEDGRDETRRRTVGDEAGGCDEERERAVSDSGASQTSPRSRRGHPSGSESGEEANVMSIGPGEKARAFEATEGRANALLPCPGRVSQLREREARLATGLHPATSRNGEMTREVDPQVEASQELRFEGPPDHRELHHRDEDESSGRFWTQLRRGLSRSLRGPATNRNPRHRLLTVRTNLGCPRCPEGQHASTCKGSRPEFSGLPARFRTHLPRGRDFG